jgi:hypothetical protein
MVLISARGSRAGIDPPGKVLGTLAIAGQVTSAVGLPLGRVPVGAIGWRVAFLINVPVALLVLLMAILWIEHDVPASGKPRVGLRGLAAEIDLSGIVLFASMIIALLVFLMSLQRPDWTTLVTTLVLAAALLFWELRARSPFFNVRALMSNLPLSLTYLRTCAMMFSVYCVFYGVTPVAGRRSWSLRSRPDWCCYR